MTVQANSEEGVGTPIGVRKERKPNLPVHQQNISWCASDIFIFFTSFNFFYLFSFSFFQFIVKLPSSSSVLPITLFKKMHFTFYTERFIEMDEVLKFKIFFEKLPSHFDAFQIRTLTSHNSSKVFQRFLDASRKKATFFFNYSTHSTHFCLSSSHPQYTDVC